MSPWPAAVAAEPLALHMLMDADARLAAAAGGVARALVDAAHLESDAATGLQSAVVEACKESFKHLSGNHSHLDITFARFRDRLEVSLSRQCDSAPPAGGQSEEGPPSQRKQNGTGSASLAGVDRVQYETQGKKCLMRLTKYFGGPAPAQ